MLRVERLLEAQAEGGVVDLVVGAGHAPSLHLEGVLIRIHHPEEALTRVDTHPVVGLAVVHVPEQHARLVAHQLVGHVDVGQSLVHPRRGCATRPGSSDPWPRCRCSSPNPARVKVVLPSAPSLSRGRHRRKDLQLVTEQPVSGHAAIALVLQGEGDLLTGLGGEVELGIGPSR